ncbi:spore germination protein [Anaerobranca gottschalkii]|uniref:Spore germination protein KA n=1 Tax=Anaerobranca gottschalkii DSM 13577 TaxID=1120990 RepID=A0A1H9YJY9_9FIRM|nr:spore germination protein [Anaerobranca gottschalkii]SES68830.1 spore germination protein KA [Anaerobranca gottschalkii DSM 13577]
MKFILRMLNDLLNRGKGTRGSELNWEANDIKEKVGKDLKGNIEKIKKYLGKSDDFKIKDFYIGTCPPLKGALIYLSSMVDNKSLEHSIIKPLQQIENPLLLEGKVSFDNLILSTIPNGDCKELQDYQSIIKEILKGKGLLLIEGFSKGLVVEVGKSSDKTHTEPKTEKVVKGPQEGFVEDIEVNTWMIRKRIKSPHLIMKSKEIGRQTSTEVRVMYMDNIADLTIVEELFSRLEKIDIDGPLGSAAIEEFINDSPRNIFNTTFYTERCDRLVAMLLEGRIGILVDGTPFAVVIPAVISDFFITTEDYYLNYYFATFNRLIGYIGAFIVLFLPSIYIAFTSYHQEMIPTRLALTIAGTRAGVPYPAFMEAFLMELAFEGLRQAGTRLPTYVGQAVSIVGALIIGTAAVDAGLVSPAVVIVVATTAIFSFTIPYTNFSLGIRLWRFFNMILATVLGIFGVMTGFLLLFLNLLSLRSFGVNFMVPFAPLSIRDLKDWFFRFPSWAITTRSNQIVRENFTKGGEELRPQPSNKRGEKIK